MKISRDEYMQEVRRYFAETLASEPGFALRESQIKMAEACAEAFYDEGLLLAEAGTGTGKTLAYLIPALLFRLKAQSEQIIISTQTLNLQSQILNSDIPRLGKNLGLEFKAVPARGRNNYLCLDRLYKLSGDMSLEAGDIDIINMINERLAESEEGLFNTNAVELAGVHSDFSFAPAKFWSRICCDPFACRGSRCRYFHRCFLFRERRELQTADIIITNHALVLADAAIRREGGQSILPSCARIVFDEAHHLEDAATSHLGASFSKKETLRLFNHLGSFSQAHESKGLITDLEMIIAASPASPEYKAEMQEAANMLTASRLLPLNDKLSLLEEELIYLFPETELKFSYDAEWISDSRAQHFLRIGKELAALMRETADDLKVQAEFLDEFPDWVTGADFKLELQSAEHLLTEYAKALDFCLDPQSPDWVFWAERTPSR
nr:DEAD/DEAH box helicase [bacterium]